MGDSCGVAKICGQSRLDRLKALKLKASRKADHEIVMRAASLAISTCLLAQAVCAADFSAELARVAGEGVQDGGTTTVASELDRLSREFPVEVDWLNQVSERPQLDDAGRSKALATYLSAGANHEFIKSAVITTADDLGAEGQPFKARAGKLSAEGVGGHDARWMDLFVDTCQARRARRLRTVMAETPRILFIKRHTVRASFYGYTEGTSDAYTERHLVQGSSLSLLDLSSGKPVVTTLLDDPTGVIRDLDVSYDASRVLFAWKKGPTINDDDYHLYEMDMETRAIRQITRGKGVAD